MNEKHKSPLGDAGDNAGSGEEEKRKRRRWLLLILLALLLLLLVGSCSWAMLSSSGPAQSIRNALNLDSSQEDSKRVAQGEGGESSGIEIRGYPDIPLAAGETVMHVALENPAGNPCYIQFTVRLLVESTDADGKTVQTKGEVLYRSGDVAPGKFVNEQRLAHGFEKGEYPIVIENTTKSLEEPHSAMNGMDVQTKLIVS